MITHLVDFPRGIVALFFIFLFYIILQVYLAIRFRAYLHARINHEGRRKLLYDLVGLILFLTLFPIAGDLFLHWDLHERYPFVMRVFFPSFAIWTFG